MEFIVLIISFAYLFKRAIEIDRECEKIDLWFYKELAKINANN